MIVAPKLGPRYWTALCLASVLGANVGDLLSRELGLGYWHGLPLLAALFGAVALAARIVPRTTAWYWLGIVLVRAAATNLSDWQILTPGEPPAVRSALSFPLVILIWGVALALLAIRDRRSPEDDDRTQADVWFWTTMLVAGTWGTAVGDWLAFGSGLEPAGATILSTLALAVTLGGLSGRAGRDALAFWILVACVRTWGTNLGDLLSDTIGLWQSVGLILAAGVVILFCWAASRRTARGVRP